MKYTILCVVLLAGLALVDCRYVSLREKLQQSLKSLRNLGNKKFHRQTCQTEAVGYFNKIENACSGDYSENEFWNEFCPDFSDVTQEDLLTHFKNDWCEAKDFVSCTVLFGERAASYGPWDDEEVQSCSQFFPEEDDDDYAKKVNETLKMYKELVDLCEGDITDSEILLEACTYVEEMNDETEGVNDEDLETYFGKALVEKKDLIFCSVVGGSIEKKPNYQRTPCDDFILRQCNDDFFDSGVDDNAKALVEAVQASGIEMANEQSVKKKSWNYFRRLLKFK